MNITFSKKKGSYFSFPFFTLLSLFLLVSCSNSSETGVNLLYNTRYKFVEQEEEVAKTDYYFEEFTTIKDTLNLDDVALYKVIKHPKYNTYIGISVDENAPKNVDYSEEITVGSLKATMQSYQSDSGKLFYAIYTSLDKDFKSFSPEQIKSRFENK